MFASRWAFCYTSGVYPPCKLLKGNRCYGLLGRHVRTAVSDILTYCSAQQNNRLQSCAVHCRLHPSLGTWNSTFSKDPLACQQNSCCFLISWFPNQRPRWLKAVALITNASASLDTEFAVCAKCEDRRNFGWVKSVMHSEFVLVWTLLPFIPIFSGKSSNVRMQRNKDCQTYISRTTPVSKTRLSEQLCYFIICSSRMCPLEELKTAMWQGKWKFYQSWSAGNCKLLTRYTRMTPARCDIRILSPLTASPNIFNSWLLSEKSLCSLSGWNSNVYEQLFTHED